MNTMSQMTPDEVIERAVGQPIKGKPDCYRVDQCAAHLAPGSQIFPQGEDGPCFVKERYSDPMTGVEQGLWRHVTGAPARRGGGFY